MLFVGIDLSARRGFDVAVLDGERGVAGLWHAATLDLLGAGLRIEAPIALPRDERDREWPVLGSDGENCGSVGFPDQAMHLLILPDELLAVKLVLARVTAADEILSCSENPHHRPFIVITDGQKERLACLSRR